MRCPLLLLSQRSRSRRRSGLRRHSGSCLFSFSGPSCFPILKSPNIASLSQGQVEILFQVSVVFTSSCGLRESRLAEREDLVDGVHDYLKQTQPMPSIMSTALWSPGTVVPPSMKTAAGPTQGRLILPGHCVSILRSETHPCTELPMYLFFGAKTAVMFMPKFDTYS